MPEDHELLKRDLDPIDDVRRQFERFYTEDYFSPINGDWISDDYYKIIDLTTKPDELSKDELNMLDEIITRLNEKYTHIERQLGSSSLCDAYNDVAEQVTAINSADLNRVNITSMQSAPLTVAS